MHRPTTQRFTHGLGRFEDLAGIASAAIVLFSARVAGDEASSRLLLPQPIARLGPLPPQASSAAPATKP